MSMTDLLLLVLTGLGAGFMGGLFGIGGGVIIVPALYAVFAAQGVPEAVLIKLAVGTSLATIIVTSIRSLQGHQAHGNVEWGILKSWGPWIALGAVMGAVLARVADATVLTLIFGLGLLLIGIQRMVNGGKVREGDKAQLPSIVWQRVWASGNGLFSSLMGIGGGVIGVLLLTRAGRTVHRAVGTASGFGLAIAVPGAIGYMLAGLGLTETPWTIGYVSLIGFAAVAAGSALVAPLGAKVAAHLNATILTRIFAAYLCLTGIMMIREAVWG